MTSLPDIATDYTAILLTGISGCGKSTIANLIADVEVPTVIIDGDVIRSRTKNFKFGVDGRVSNCVVGGQLLSEVKIPSKFPILCMESPTIEMRQAIYDNAPQHKVLTIHIDVTKETASGRDPKGLYSAEAAGELERPMVGDDYERGDDIDITINNNDKSQIEVSSFILGILQTLN